ncbi:hypothetical protein [Xenorhabdus bovienii]|uniref:hypothetical protein n=1 Tax=Xenorhabdus bovienii TaxID=40576 RepID=UPI003DA37DC1
MSKLTTSEKKLDAGYRLKTRTIKIGDIDVPEPVREPLENEQKYYYPCILSDEWLCGDVLWWGDLYDVARLNRGLIHLDPESAELHAKALISLTASTKTLTVE